jgi:hypothetical protein
MIDKCKDVKWSTTEFSQKVRPVLRTGSLVWDPKMGEGHVLVAQEKVVYWVEPDIIWLCECGHWDWQDHHTYFDSKDSNRYG